MGLLTLFTPPSSEADQRAASIRSGAVAPSRSERERCWAARDAYFGCLDRHAIDDALGGDGAAAAAARCGPEGAVLERDCAAKWVTYFKQWRVQNIKKQAAIRELEAQGAERMEVSTTFTRK